MPRSLWRSDRFRRQGAEQTRETSGTGACSYAGHDQAVNDELNRELNTLSELFPDVQFEVFREMLLTFSPASRLHVITEALLSGKSRHVAGRWRPALPNDNVTLGTEATTSQNDLRVPQSELFRSEPYKASVKDAFYEEFSGLKHSMIKGVLAEKNWSYSDSRPILIEINAKTWRNTLKNILFPRKVTAPLEHPLVMGDLSDEHEAMALRVRTDVNDELSEEIRKTVIEPIRAKYLEKQFRADEKLAEQLNSAEAEAADATYECRCCFSAVTFERLTVCSTHQHFICFRCLARTTSEALYGQGWGYTVKVDKCTLTCLALSSGSDGACSGWIPRDHLKAALSPSQGPAGLWQQFEERVAESNLASTGHTLTKCPFCPYAEIAPFWVASNNRNVDTVPDLIRRRSWPLPSSPIAETGEKPSNGRKFICRSPQCSRASCLNCLALWKDPHSCFSSSADSLRAYVEAATTAAVKRTCPSCGLSFIKASGCNHLVCRCGYAMCYLCRADLRGDKYNHFCMHFRPDGGQCQECMNCNLFQDEDEEAIVKRARVQAEREWWEMEHQNNLTKHPQDADGMLKKMQRAVGENGGLFR